MEKILSPRGLVFILIFAILAFVSLQINVSKIQGVNSKDFTLFEFFGPISGAFLGTIGIALVGIAKLIAFAVGVVNGKTLITSFGGLLVDLAKLTPMMFAAYYFSTKNKSDLLCIAIPVIAMIAFWLNPIGREAWYYALYWLIPIGARFFQDKLVIRSLGTTFTAHEVGSVLFLYTIPSVPALWIGLIPIVFIERVAFALGISASFLLFTNVLNAVDKLVDTRKMLNIEKQYVLNLAPKKDRME